jgi:hypothetical protein
VVCTGHSASPPQALQSAVVDRGFQFGPPPFPPVSGHSVPAYSYYLQIIFKSSVHGFRGLPLFLDLVLRSFNEESSD